MSTTLGPISPQRQLAAQIRLAEHAVLKTEGRWRYDCTPERAAKLTRRRNELAELQAQRQALIAATDNLYTLMRP
jgi:hypothetical protein